MTGTGEGWWLAAKTSERKEVGKSDDELLSHVQTVADCFGGDWRGMSRSFAPGVFGIEVSWGRKCRNTVCDAVIKCSLFSSALKFQ